MKEIDLNKYQFLEKLKRIQIIKRIILFGSRARGDSRLRSDIDLAIDCPGANDNDWHHILDIVEQADTLLNIDCVRFDTLLETDPLKRSIERDGINLYKKDAHE